MTKRAYTWPNVRRLFDPFEGFQKLQGTNQTISSDTLMTQQPAPTFGVYDRPFQSFGIKVANNGGTLQARLMTDVLGEPPPWYASQVQGGTADNTYKTIKTLTTTQGFDGCVVGIISGATERLALNTGPQPEKQPIFGVTRIDLYTGNIVAMNIGLYTIQRNILGKNWWRPEFIFVNELSGALVAVSTGNIPSGLNLSFRFFGFIL